MSTTSTPQNLQISVFTEQDDFLQLENDWEQLWGKSCSSSLFNSFLWCRLWWAENKRDADTAYIFLVRDNSGKLVALFPLYLSYSKTAIFTNRYLQFISQDTRLEYSSFAESLDLLIDEDSDDTAIIDLLAKYLIEHSSQWSKASFSKIHHDSYIHRIHMQLQKLDNNAFCASPSKRLALDVEIDHLDLGEAIPLQADLSASYGHHYKLLSHTGKFDLIEAEDADDLIQQLHSLVQIECAHKRKLQDGFCCFDDDGYLAFYENLCEQLALTEQVRIYSLTMEGRLLASMCWFEDVDNLHCFHLASVKGDGVRFAPELILLKWALNKQQGMAYQKLIFHSSILFSDELAQLDSLQTIETIDLTWALSKQRSYMLQSAKRLSNLLRSETNNSS